MPKHMPKDRMDDPATMKRKNDNYLAKKHNRGSSAGTSKQEPEDSDLAAKADEALKTSNDLNSKTTNKPKNHEDQRIALPTLNIPFKTQRRILTTLQTWLEEACFQFFQKWTPGTLNQKGLKDAEQVELTEWGKLIGREIKTLPKNATQRIPGTNITQELTALHHLTDAAVHRQPLTVLRLLEIIGGALNLMTIMKDDRKVSLIETLEKSIQDSVRTCELQQEDLKARLSHDLEYIDAQTKSFTSMEKGCIENARRVHEGYQDMVGAMLTNFLDGKPDAPVNSSIPQLPVWQVHSERHGGLQQSVAPPGVRIFGQYTKQGVAPFGKPDWIVDPTPRHPVPTEMPKPLGYKEVFAATGGTLGTKSFDFTVPGGHSWNHSKPDSSQSISPARPESGSAEPPAKTGPSATSSNEPAASMKAESDNSQPSDSLGFRAMAEARAASIWGRARDVRLTGQLLSPSPKATAASGDPVKKETPPKDRLPIFGQAVFSFPSNRNTQTSTFSVPQKQQASPETNHQTIHSVSRAADSAGSTSEL